MTITFGMPSVRLVSALLVAAVFCSDAGTTNAETPGSKLTKLPLELLVPGNFIRDELPPDVGGPWYALTVSGGTAVLKRVQVHLKSIKNPRATGDPSVPGAAVESDIPDSVLFFFRGRTFEPSEVSTWYLGAGVIQPGSELPINSPGHRWSVSASQQRYDRRYMDYIYDITIRDHKQGHTKRFGTWKATNPDFEWVGDLDGDGRIDMFVSDWSSETGSKSWTLYLSGGAAEEDFLKIAAHFGIAGC